MSNAATYKLNEYDELFKTLDANGPLFSEGVLKSLKARAVDRYKKLGLPTIKQEDWRFINLKSLVETQFSGPSSKFDSHSALEAAESKGILGLSDINIVFVNGEYRADLSSSATLSAGVTVKPFSDGATSDPIFQSYIGQIASDEQHPFMALNTALFSDGLYIHVPAKTVVSSPINVIHITTEQETPVIFNPRVLAIAEPFSQITIIETFVGPDNLAYFTNPVSEFVIAENAHVDHYRNQFDGNSAFHIATLDARQERTSTFSTQTFTFGGKITRNDVGLLMDGEGGHGTMNALYHINKSQVVDNHTRIDHAQPNCETHELFKGVLNDNARGVFNGRIMVRQIAQKTDSKQTNRTLLLSSDALINTNPQLEIFADDVKCTHGATVGQLDDNQLYYLRSRGISADESRRLLVFAFANDVVEKVHYAPLRDLLEQKLLATQDAATAMAKA